MWLKRLLIILLFVIGIAGNLFAAIKKPGATAANFLKLGIGARPSGLGEAFCAVADDINAVYCNPAGLALVKEYQFTAEYKGWFEDIRGGYLCYLQPAGKSAVSVGMTYLSYGQIREITVEKEPKGNFSPEDIGANFSFAYQISPDFLIGTNLKYVSQKITEVQGVGYATDIGLLYKHSKFFSFGLAAQNIGSKIKFVKEDFSLPFNIKTGVAFKNKVITLALDFNKPVDNNPYICLGLESMFGNVVSLRLGYREQFKNQKLDLYERSPIGFVGGLGIGLGNAYFLDYAYVPYGDLGNTHRVSFTMKFVPREKEEEIPEIVIPVPEEVIPEIPEEEIPKEVIEEIPAKEVPTKEIPEVKEKIKPKEEKKIPEVMPIKPPTKLLPKTLLKPTPPEIEAPPITEKEIVVIMDNATIWSGTGVTYDKITTVNKGTKLILLDDSQEWYYKVLLPDGTTGWISYVFVSK